MAETTPRRPTLFASIAGLALVAAAAVVGFDLSGNDTPSNAPSSPSPSPQEAAHPKAAAEGTETSTTPAATISGLDACSIDTLPEEARDTAEDIRSGGPYQFPDNDNTRFGNYEGLLPDHEPGYYREYTVITPGLNHRGERRIVTGGAETDPEVWYYTADHYESFCEIYDADQ